MRLIDAYALTKALADLWYDGKITITGVAVADLIDNAPTVDTVSKDLFEQYKWERDTALATLEEHGLSLGQKKRHGKWEIWSSPFSDDGAIDMIKCSECEWDRKDAELVCNIPTNYCPNCGAKMDKEQQQQVTGKLKNLDDSLLTADSEACKEQKSKLDLISRQDAIEAVRLESAKRLLLGRGDILDILEEIPTVDAVEAVRCKDCKYSIDYYNDGDCYCRHPKYHGESLLYIQDGWRHYCSYAERRNRREEE